MKTIAIQDGLETLKEKLTSLGYEVVSSEEINFPVDAYIYYEQNDNQSLLMVNQRLNNIFSSVSPNMQPNYGTLLINAKDKTVEEIQQILTNRTYSPLF